MKICLGGATMKIGCIQMNVRFGKVEENYAHAEALIRQAAEQGAEIIVLPEMWNSGYALEQLSELADVQGERTQAFLQQLSQQLGVHIVGGSVSTKQDGGFYNTMYTYDNAGRQVGDYSKVHLFRLMDEHLHLQAGSSMNRFQLGDIEAAGVICYDIRFPEWLRSHALAGAKVLFVSAQWPTPRIDHWKTLLQARAIENQCFIVAVNRIANKKENFNGQSMIIEPWGDILWTGGDEEELAVIDVDLSVVDEIRERIPVYDDRRPNLYEGVVNSK